MSTPPAGLEVRELDVHDDAAFAAWHHVYATAERHELGDVASVWQLEEIRALMQHPGTAAWSGGWSGILDVLEAVAVARGRRVLTGLVGWEPSLGSDGVGASGPEFAGAHGHDLALSEVQRELRLPVDETPLAALADDAARVHPAYTLRSWVGPVPDDLVTGWAELSSSLATEAPTGELDLEPEVVSVEVVREREATLARQGRTKYNTVALDADGTVVAYTDLATTVHEPGRAYQWGTLVRRRDRGHRLGVAVKVANLRLLQRERPDIVRLTTYNAEVNAHMIGVNEALGFRPVARLGDFQKKLL